MRRKLPVILVPVLGILVGGALVLSGSMPGVVAGATDSLAHRGVEDELERFADASLPLDDRAAAIQDLAARDDERSRRLLMELADRKVYLSHAAVAALAGCSGAEVAEFLRAKLDDPDARIASAAMGSYAQVCGEGAVQALVATLEGSYQRQEGFEAELRTRAVEVLGEISSVRAVPALEAELLRVADPGFSLEYGSVIVAALRRISDPSSRPVLEIYVRQLSTSMPEHEESASYYREKIAEVRKTSNGF